MAFGSIAACLTASRNAAVGKPDACLTRVNRSSSTATASAPSRSNATDTSP
jgi:hypothetical protein